MAASNKHGLSRTIPADVARQVRQRSGFGCVRCGSGIYTYEHFDPEFADASSHDVNGITLLCANCHLLKTKGQLSLETLKRHVAEPKCLSIGYSFGPFDLSHRAPPTVVIGMIEAVDVEVALHMAGEDVLSIRPPVEAGAPFRFNAVLRDKHGRLMMEIVDNEWRVGIDNFDFKFEGRHLTVADQIGEIALTIRADPPGRFTVEKLITSVERVGLVCNGSEVIVSYEGRTSGVLSKSYRIGGWKYAIFIDEFTYVGKESRPGVPNYIFGGDTYVP